MKRKRISSPAKEPLPLPGQRWVTRRKAALVDAVRNGRITVEEVCSRYELSPEEFTAWLAMFDRYGAPGLRATRFQIYRDVQPHRRPAPPSTPNFATGTVSGQIAPGED